MAAPWQVEYGSDSQLTTNYKDGVTIEVAGGVLKFQTDNSSEVEKFNEWGTGRRAPMITRTDIPAGDWRLETKYVLKDTLSWDQFNVGLFVAYDDNTDKDVSGKGVSVWIQRCQSAGGINQRRLPWKIKLS